MRRVPDDPEEDGDPPPRDRHALAAAGARVLLFGGHNAEGCGEGGGESCGDTWEWDGTSWARRQPVDPEGDGDPGPRRDHVPEYDSRRDRLVLMGGQYEGVAGNCGEGRGGQCAYTWELPFDELAGRFPGQALRVRVRSALSSGLDGIDLRSVTARWVAGGVGRPGGVETPGVRLHVWDPGVNVWQEVDRHDAPPGDPAELEWTTEDPELLDRLLVGQQHELSLGVTPAPNGTGTARIASDDVEVTVRYRRE